MSPGPTFLHPKVTPAKRYEKVWDEIRTSVGVMIQTTETLRDQLPRNACVTNLSPANHVDVKCHTQHDKDGGNM